MWNKIMVKICDDKLNYDTSVIIQIAQMKRAAKRALKTLL